MEILFNPLSAKNDLLNAKNDTGLSNPSKILPPAGPILGVYKKDEDHLTEVCSVFNFS
jgi:hypothetical protein